MPDDDYEMVRVGYECYDLPQTPACTCEHCSKINAKKDKARQIETLLAEAEKTTSGDHATVYLVKVLRLMNGIE